jgi:predicted metalloprotease with PDZ domain
VDRAARRETHRAGEEGGGRFGDIRVINRANWISLCLLPALVHAQAGVEYTLRYALASPQMVAVTLTLPEPVKAPATLVMPRTYPGGYEQFPYDAFVTQIVARSSDGTSVQVHKSADGPRWTLGLPGQVLRVIEYRVDVGRMEADIGQAVSASKVRKRYAGLLGYSVFAFVEGLADRKVMLSIQAPKGWPVLSTLDPAMPTMPTGTSVAASDYDELADSQMLMGPDLHVTRLAGAIPLVMAVYSEGRADEALEGQLAREALDRVQAYFGDIPIAHYTVQLELLRPRAGHTYLFSQEHVRSGSFSFAADAALTAHSSAEERDRVRFNFAHHMAHSWVPARVYGAGYRPIIWEMTPVIDTIWFNEGFGRYAGLMALADGMRPPQGKAFRAMYLQSRHATLDEAPLFIRRMPLAVLSREASFLYSVDFRTGGNVAARGLLMAAEMDDRIQEESHGEKSLRDAFRWILLWSAQHGMPLQTENFPGYIESATGVKVNDIFERWQQPLDP